jgi:hypothetical protein
MAFWDSIPGFSPMAQNQGLNMFGRRMGQNAMQGQMPNSMAAAIARLFGFPGPAIQGVGTGGPVPPAPVAGFTPTETLLNYQGRAGVPQRSTGSLVDDAVAMRAYRNRLVGARLGKMGRVSPLRYTAEGKGPR